MGILMAGVRATETAEMESLETTTKNGHTDSKQASTTVRRKTYHRD